MINLLMVKTNKNLTNFKDTTANYFLGLTQHCAHAGDESYFQFSTVASTQVIDFKTKICIHKAIIFILMDFIFSLFVFLLSLSVGIRLKIINFIKNIFFALSQNQINQFFAGLYTCSPRKFFLPFQDFYQTIFVCRNFLDGIVSPFFGCDVHEEVHIRLLLGTNFQCQHHHLIIIILTPFTAPHKQIYTLTIFEK